MAETIETQFDVSSLPEWARKIADVVTFAKNNLAFRCDVCSAKTKQEQNRLRGVAERVQNYRENRRS